ncbi:MAG TPA: AMP-binding protein [Iamia sp.]
MHPGTFAEATPNKRAVIMPDGRSLTYRQLEEGSNQVAHLFRASGLRPGDHIAMVCENRPEYFVVAWGAQRAGLYYTPCSTRLGTAELEHIVEDSGARVLVATEATVGALAESTLPGIERRLLVDGAVEGWEPLPDLLAGQPVTPIADQVEGDSMMYSSGTTGRPKGVKSPLTGAPYPHLGEAGELAELFGMSSDTVLLSPAPLYHAAPMFLTFIVHRIGGTVIVQERFDPEEFLRLVDEHRVTTTQVVPTMFIRLLKLPDETRARYDVSSLQRAIHSAAPCPIEVKERMIDWWGPVIDEYYSATEGNGFVYCTSEEWLAHKGTVGQSLMGPLHIVGDDGEELPVGERGTIYFDGGRFEYHHDEEKTRQSRDPRGRGWSTLGDVGYLDDDGYLYLTDRKAYTIISGGVNIYPQEAENALSLHPKVEDVAVFGIPHDEMGEQVHAVVQPAEGVSGSDELAAELIQYCRDRLAGYKCPRSVEFRTELPRHATGKLYKRLLKDEHWQGRSLAG